MNGFKKAGIIGGAAVGGVIGGTVSFIGKMTNQKLLDEIGSSIVDSTIYTGEIVGDIAGGTVHMVGGVASKNQEKTTAGKEELKQASGKVVDNVVGNVKLVATEGTAVAKGIRAGDREQTKKAIRKLGKVVAVGLMSAGAIKISKEKDENKD